MRGCGFFVCVCVRARVCTEPQIKAQRKGITSKIKRTQNTYLTSQKKKSNPRDG